MNIYYQNRKNFWQYEHAIAIPFVKFVSIKLRELFIKLAAIKKRLRTVNGSIWEKL